MRRRPPCGKWLTRSQTVCNRGTGHKGHCENIDKVRKAARNASYALLNPERKAATEAAWNTRNPGRNAAAVAVWAADNRERKAASNAAWDKANPLRKKALNQKRYAIKRGLTTVPYTVVEYIARMAELGDTCFYCALLGVVGPHECDDHFFPLQPRKGHRNGAHALWNLYPSCKKHNSQKHNKQPLTFISKLIDSKVAFR